jgi:hypothetical protein
MHPLFIPGAALFAMLLGSSAIAQDTSKQTPVTQGKSLAEPYHQQQADDAMHTESGMTGKTEPGTHAPLQGDRPVLKDGKLNPSTPPDGQSGSASAPR